MTRFQHVYIYIHTYIHMCVYMCVFVRTVQNNYSKVGGELVRKKEKNTCRSLGTRVFLFRVYLQGSSLHGTDIFFYASSQHKHQRYRRYLTLNANRRRFREIVVAIELSRRGRPRAEREETPFFFFLFFAFLFERAFPLRHENGTRGKEYGVGNINNDNDNDKS